MEEFLIDIQKQHVTIRESIWKHKIKFDDTRFVKIISKEHKTDEDAEVLLYFKTYFQVFVDKYDSLPRYF